ncbi:hypothetical protein GCM10010377_49000 [Streptomyces viridiviolaceus]|nr:hypothetical protein GCM10010377_49000 [Streptomyces viridiviolaceus]
MRAGVPMPPPRASAFTLPRMCNLVIIHRPLQRSAFAVVTLAFLDTHAGAQPGLRAGAGRRTGLAAPSQGA